MMIAPHLAGLARRYVTALLESATTRPGFPALRGELERLSGVIAESSDLQALLLSPRVKAGDQQRALAAILARAGFSDVVVGFVRVVLQNRRGAVLADLITAALDALNRAEGIAEADVHVAAPLTAPQEKKLAELLSTWSGARVGLNVKVSPDVLAGMRIRLGSMQIDDSVAGKLVRLRNNLRAHG